MYERLAVIAESQAGVVTRAQAIAAGYRPDDVDYLLKRGEWISLRRGAYIRRDLYESLNDIGLHRAHVHAVARSLREPAVISHVSAAVMHGLDLWDVDLSVVHVSRANLHSARREAGVHHHAGSVADGDVVEVEGLRVMGLPRTIIDTARTMSFEKAVCIADSAARADAGAIDAAHDRLNTMRDWQGSRNAGAVVAFATGKSESVGESRLRVLFHTHGLPAPELQVEFRTASGLFIARTDFYFRAQRTIGEFDGKVKYLGEPGATDNPGAVLWKEKRREDELRRQGDEVERVIWVDLDRPRVVAARFREAFARAERRGGRAA